MVQTVTYTIIISIYHSNSHSLLLTNKYNYIRLILKTDIIAILQYNNNIIMASNWFANFVIDDSNNNNDNVELQWSNSNSNDSINNDEEAIVDNIPVDDTIDNESVNNNNNIAIDNNNSTRRNYSVPLSKVVIILLAAFALSLGIGWGSGYGIAEKIWSNRNKAAASSGKVLR